MAGLFFSAVFDEPFVHLFAAEIIAPGVLVVGEAFAPDPLVNGAPGKGSRKVFAQLVDVHPFRRTGAAGVLLQKEGKALDFVAKFGQYAGHAVEGDSCFC